MPPDMGTAKRRKWHVRGRNGDNIAALDPRGGNGGGGLQAAALSLEPRVSGGMVDRTMNVQFSTSGRRQQIKIQK
ncbi:hypothetical protein Ancab_023907 [Ancistrocladus abbreviatus]